MDPEKLLAQEMIDGNTGTIHINHNHHLINHHNHQLINHQFQHNQHSPEWKTKMIDGYIVENKFCPK
jgi:hypothetical protein